MEKEFSHTSVNTSLELGCNGNIERTLNNYMAFTAIHLTYSDTLV